MRVHLKVQMNWIVLENSTGFAFRINIKVKLVTSQYLKAKIVNPIGIKQVRIPKGSDSQMNTEISGAPYVTLRLKHCQTTLEACPITSSTITFTSQPSYYQVSQRLHRKANVADVKSKEIKFVATYSIYSNLDVRSSAIFVL